MPPPKPEPDAEELAARARDLTRMTLMLDTISRLTRDELQVVRSLAADQLRRVESAHAKEIVVGLSRMHGPPR